jgi:RHH-type proline utilization regulon transcriptional repressor/proline dehydrogenase/delta 1-pyrroline-5-carboxylate dehydrogenase
VISVDGIEDVKEEVFGPVLHLATSEADEIDAVIDAINATGFGLTFGLHTRIDSRVQYMMDRVDVGNIYINRNQIGAVVGSQPFGGHGLSGTGPKAGGPRYLSAFGQDNPDPATQTQHLPGPTGEENTYTLHPRSGILCAGPGAELAREQAQIAESLGCHNIVIAPDAEPDAIMSTPDISVVLYWGEIDQQRQKACAARNGQITKLVKDKALARHLFVEKVSCVDTTASGGNAELLAAAV